MKTIRILKDHGNLHIRQKINTVLTDGVLLLYTKWAYIVTDITKLL